MTVTVTNYFDLRWSQFWPVRSPSKAGCCVFVQSGLRNFQTLKDHGPHFCFRRDLAFIKSSSFNKASFGYTVGSGGPTVVMAATLQRGVEQGAWDCRRGGVGPTQHQEESTAQPQLDTGHTPAPQPKPSSRGSQGREQAKPCARKKGDGSQCQRQGQARGCQVPRTSQGPKGCF